MGKHYHHTHHHHTSLSIITITAIIIYYCYHNHHHYHHHHNHHKFHHHHRYHHRYHHTFHYHHDHHYFSIFRLYYQKNEFFPFPESCSRLYSSPTDITLQSLSRCTSEQSTYNKFFNTSCIDSFSTICNAAYTNNPPFSCERYIHPDVLTTIGMYVCMYVCMLYDINSNHVIIKS